MMWNLLVSGLLVGSTVVAVRRQPRLSRPRGAVAAGRAAPGSPASAPARRTSPPARTPAWCRASSPTSAGSAPSAPPARRCRPRGSPGSTRRSPGDEPDLLLASVSGGTDVCTALRGRDAAARGVRRRDPDPGVRGRGRRRSTPTARAVLDEVGELVVTEPMPSMPIGFWGDDDGSRLRESYFEDFPGVWRHGDWCKLISARGSLAIYGRSDSTLNRGGVRMGTAEFYRVVDEVDGVADSAGRGGRRRAAAVRGPRRGRRARRRPAHAVATHAAQRAYPAARARTGSRRCRTSRARSTARSSRCR